MHGALYLENSEGFFRGLHGSVCQTQKNQEDGGRNSQEKRSDMVDKGLERTFLFLLYVLINLAPIKPRIRDPLLSQNC